jgi:16S rRNA (cytosine967-C5)-methyltransferase
MKKQGVGSREEGVEGAAGGGGGKRSVMKKRPASAGPTASAGAAMAKITPARLAAFEILKLVGEGKGHSDELLHSARVDALSPEDRNLTTALVMGVLRWQIALDARVRGLLQRPEQRLAEPVAIALRMGAFQLLHLERIPAHAALSESVELCRAAGEPHATGMVNAVLRKVAKFTSQNRETGYPTKPTSQNRDVGHPDSRVGDPDRPMLQKRDAGHPDRTARRVPLHESVAAFAERLGHPRWMVERWVAEYGRDAALKICEADQKEPADGGMFHDRGGDLPQMDDGSRLVAELAAAAMPGARRVWDCCAAPGGKTLILARRLGSAEVVASDASAKRLAQTEARLRRYAYAERVEFVAADAADAKAVEGSFDLILCDVPCSGTGTLAGNPEIRHRLKVEELARQAERQTAILKGALKRLAPGGRLVYSTCSLEPEECESVAEAVVAAGGVKRISVDGLIAELGEQGILLHGVELDPAVRDGSLRTLPGVHGCDGFYAVVLERE